MKKLFVLFLLLLLYSNIFAQSENIKVMTYNIRCGYCEDVSSVNNWSKRKFLVAYMIKTNNPDLIGLQEAEQFQIKDLIEMLDDYDYYGVGRDDGKEKGESAAVLYKKNRFALLSEITLWLSETPDKISKGWDAALNRTVTILKLNDLKNSKELYFLNTHFDHMGEKARTESSRLIVNEINKIALTLPVILTGDFNYTSSADGYKIITQNLFDTDRISKTESTGGNISFNGFGKDVKADNKIDFIFVNNHIDVLTHLIDTTTFNGLYPSDHYPVISEIRLK
jgi:endonuclease/exonuclease/phosphatase family metal-dependent hydrolase